MISGTVLPGNRETLTVTLDLSNVELGVHNAILFVGSNSEKAASLADSNPYGRDRLSSSVNAGSPFQYTDALSDVWRPDQAWSEGDRGYLNRGHIWFTFRDFVGTEDDWLHSTQRINPHGYRFDRLPAGVYQVELPIRQTACWRVPSGAAIQ